MSQVMKSCIKKLIVLIYLIEKKLNQGLKLQLVLMYRVKGPHLYKKILLTRAGLAICLMIQAKIKYENSKIIYIGKKSLVLNIQLIGMITTKIV